MKKKNYLLLWIISLLLFILIMPLRGKSNRPTTGNGGHVIDLNGIK